MIRKALESDKDRIFEIYETAREFMRKTGNPNQWGNSHPPADSVLEHLSHGELYVYDDGGRVQGVFALVSGRDRTYAYIEDGQWLNDEPYLAMHMVASSGEVKGVFGRFCRYAKQQCGNVRIDTHYDNLIMQHCIEKNGFRHCGRIFLEDGSPRKAYQWVAD